MLLAVHPKLPMRSKTLTEDFYITQLEFQPLSSNDYNAYLMVQKDQVQIHFFEYRELNPGENYGQIYIRVDDIDAYYQGLLNKGVDIHPNGQLETKPWRQREFSLLDPDNNLLTFGQSI
jgi:hypothetical protein